MSGRRPTITDGTRAGDGPAVHRPWTLRAAVLLIAMLLLAVLPGCGAFAGTRIGATLGAATYIIDDAGVRAESAVADGPAEVAALRARIRDDYRQPELAETLDDVDPAASIVVAHSYDGCTVAGPELRLKGNRIRVHYARELKRNCYRPEDTLVVFSVARVRVPADAVFEV